MAARLSLRVYGVASLVFWAGAVAGQDELDLTELSLEALLDIQVTSVAKRPQELAEAAAAVYVLSGDEALRSGARTIPEALRLIPGLHVAQIDGQRWAITARGFNGTVADKLEVLIDGRSVYSPLFSGVFWDAQDIFMPDLDRIEVIRGPASVLWGSNAVNGVVNIVTKSAADTQGSLAYAGGGNEQTSFAGIRHGGQWSEGQYWRAYLRHWERDEQVRGDGSGAQDAIAMHQAGLRFDGQGKNGDSWLLDAVGYANELQNFDEALNPQGKDNEQSGGHLLARWQRPYDEESTLSIQFFWEHTERTQQGNFGEKRDTVDVELRHSLRLGERHQLVWGLGHRISRDEQENPPLIVFIPAKRTVQNSNLFASDQITLSPSSQLSLGLRIEHNEFAGFAVQPDIRINHTLNERTAIWGSLSRALRMPNRLDSDVLIPIPNAGAIGNPDFEPEELFAKELGLRHAISPGLSIEASAFHNDYDRLRGVEPRSEPELPLIVNNYQATASGLELTSTWRPNSQLALHFAYNYLQLDLEPHPDTADRVTEAAEDQAPSHQAWMRWDWQPSSKHQWGGQLRYVDDIPGFAVESFWDLSVRWAYRLNPSWSVALNGQNLLQSQRREWEINSEIERSIFAEIIWQPGRKR
nr:TonB-dependent receptor [Oceanococcus sp. HetDA_MAG_MS8]